jgi:hypothetical protein
MSVNYIFQWLRLITYPWNIRYDWKYDTIKLRKSVASLPNCYLTKTRLSYQTFITSEYLLHYLSNLVITVVGESEFKEKLNILEGQSDEHLLLLLSN